MNYEVLDFYTEARNPIVSIEVKLYGPRPSSKPIFRAHPRCTGQRGGKFHLIKRIRRRYFCSSLQSPLSAFIFIYLS
jgi:hypothetical protein